MGFGIVVFTLVWAVALGLFSGMPAVDASTRRTTNVPAIFVFGDSLADVGTNNYLPQATARANFPPYGKSYFKTPTGRFSDGLLLVDFLALALGLPFAPPFLQPNASFTRGVNFASAGSGLLDSTGGGLVRLVIPTSVQVQQFGTAKSILQQQLGVEAANTRISKSIFFLVSGSNDLFAFISNTTLQQEINATDYLASLIGIYQKTLMALYNGGARKGVVNGLGAIGCAPLPRSLNPTLPGECLVEANQLALAFNTALKQLVDTLRASYPDFNLIIVFTYDVITDFTANGNIYFGLNTTSACCGAGFLNAQVQCGKPVPPNLPNAVADFCKVPSKSLFWDFAHPTQFTVNILFLLFFNGDNTTVYPINIKALAELR